MKPPTYAGAPYDEEKDKDAIKAALQRLDDRDRFMIQFTTLLLIPNISADIKERVHRMIRTGSGITKVELDKIQKLVETELDKFAEFFKLAYGRD